MKRSKEAKKAVQAVKQGKVIICPTDTVYGLIADATDKKAVSRVFKIKKRARSNPLPIFVKSIEAAKDLAFIGQKEEKFLKKNWPGKVTVVLRRKTKNKKQKIYGLDKKTIALRIPDHKMVGLLLKKTDLPLTGTSANISGLLASTKIKEVVNQFKGQKQKPDLIFDRGNLKPSLPSKIIDLTSSFPKVLRK